MGEELPEHGVMLQKDCYSYRSPEIRVAFIKGN